MFERYTERARRVLFFARYEASQMGSISIDTEHLLLGLLREGKGMTSRVFARAHVSLEAMRHALDGRVVFREKVSPSVEIPFSVAAKRALEFAAREADLLRHEHIGTEHLLLGLLREERGVAATVLGEAGLTLGEARNDIQAIVGERQQRARDDEEAEAEAAGAAVAGLSSDSAVGRPHGHPFRRSPVPLYLPSAVVHIAFSREFAGGDPKLSTGLDHWLAVNATLRYLAARVHGVRDERVQLANPEMEALRFDVALLLPPNHPGKQSMEMLVLAALEEQLNLTIVRTTTPEGDVVTVAPLRST